LPGKQRCRASGTNRFDELSSCFHDSGLSVYVSEPKSLAGHTPHEAGQFSSRLVGSVMRRLGSMTRIFSLLPAGALHLLAKPQPKLPWLGMAFDPEV
jgi:hypothetical protein